MDRAELMQHFIRQAEIAAKTGIESLGPLWGMTEKTKEQLVFLLTSVVQPVPFVTKANGVEDPFFDLACQEQATVAFNAKVKEIIGWTEGEVKGSA